MNVGKDERKERKEKKKTEQTHFQLRAKTKMERDREPRTTTKGFRSTQEGNTFDPHRPLTAELRDVSRSAAEQRRSHEEEEESMFVRGPRLSWQTQIRGTHARNATPFRETPEIWQAARTLSGLKRG